MNAEKKHKYWTYGRIILGTVAFAVFAVLGVTAAFTHTIADKMILLGAPLLLSVIFLPRDTVPKGNDIDLDEETLQHYGKVRTWLIWFRIVIFIVAVGIFLVLPEVI